MIKFFKKLKLRFDHKDNLYGRLAITFFLGLVGNVVGCIFGYSVVHKFVYWTMLSGFFAPIINFSVSYLFIEAKTLQEKINIVLVNSVSLSIGGAVVSLYF